MYFTYLQKSLIVYFGFKIAIFNVYYGAFQTKLERTAKAEVNRKITIMV